MTAESQGILRTALGQYLAGPVEHTDACPDCDASVVAREVDPGVFRVTILHDDTCPELARLENRR